MLTNGGKAIATFPDNADSLISASGSEYPKCSIECKDTTGTTHFFSPRYKLAQHYVTFTDMNQNAAPSGIYIGSGNTPATADDYTLESQITSGLSAQSPSTVFGYDNATNEVTLSYVLTLTNTSSSDITVSELGITDECYFGDVLGGNISGTGNSYKRSILMDRTILESPVTIEPSGSAVLHYTFKYPGYVSE